MTDLANLTLAAAADGIRRGAFSSWDLAKACLARIAAWQPAINAFRALDHGGALKAAAAADAAAARGVSLGWLHGVPLAHKDVFARAGVSLSAGSALARGPDTATATALARLDGAGALDLGALQCTEFAAGPTGHNVHFGDVANPWDRTRIPGGSSSGSGAAVAARLVFGALGTDTGGSIRFPAHFCGVVGLRPTYGRVSRARVFPRAWSFDTVGPIARTAEDAALLLRMIAGPDPADAGAEAAPVPDYLAEINRPLTGRRIGVTTHPHFTQVDPGIGALLDASLDVFRRLGAEIVPVEIPDPAPLIALGMAASRAEAAAIHERWLIDSPEAYGPGLKENLEVGLYLPATRYIDALRRRGPLLKEWLGRVFGAVDMLHVPVFGAPTPTLDASRPGTAGAPPAASYGAFTWPFTYLGLPCLAVPVGFQPDGMPAAMQLVGRPFDEARLLNAGHLYQRETGWHEKAPQLG